MKTDHIFYRIFKDLPETFFELWEGYPKIEVLNLLETIILTKLPKMSRKELETMFGVDDLRKTRFAQELIEEGEKIGEQKGKLQTIPQLLKEGFSVEKIALILQLDVQKVREFMANLN